MPEERSSGWLADCAEAWLGARSAAACLFWARPDGQDLLHVRLSVRVRTIATSAIYRFALVSGDPAEISPQDRLRDLQNRLRRTEHRLREQSGDVGKSVNKLGEAKGYLSIERRALCGRMRGGIGREKVNTGRWPTSGDQEACPLRGESLRTAERPVRLL